MRPSHKSLGVPTPARTRLIQPIIWPQTHIASFEQKEAYIMLNALLRIRRQVTAVPYCWRLPFWVGQAGRRLVAGCDNEWGSGGNFGVPILPKRGCLMSGGGCRHVYR